MGKHILITDGTGFIGAHETGRALVQLMLVQLTPVQLEPIGDRQA
jgi:hypothetical protein